MSEYITFKKFITPGFIIAIYILGALVVTILSIILMVGGFSFAAGSGMGGDIAVISGIIVLIFGNLFKKALKNEIRRRKKNAKT